MSTTSSGGSDGEDYEEMLPVMTTCLAVSMLSAGSPTQIPVVPPHGPLFTTTSAKRIFGATEQLKLH